MVHGGKNTESILIGIKMRNFDRIPANGSEIEHVGVFVVIFTFSSNAARPFIKLLFLTEGILTLTRSYPPFSCYSVKYGILQIF